MLSAQIGLVCAIGALGYIDPLNQITVVAVLASLIAFLSATQDVAIDAYRREILLDEELGLGNALHVQAYRIASLVPGSLSLILADILPWVLVFWITAAFMGVGILLSLTVTEPQQVGPQARTLRETLVAPFSEYFKRVGWRSAALALFFMVAYKLGDNMATALATRVYLDLGFSMTEIGLVAKHAALWPAIAGGLFGGILMLRLGINRALWIFGLVQMISILGFAWLASVGNVLWLLAAVIAFEYLGVGLGTAAHRIYRQRVRHSLQPSLRVYGNRGCAALTGQRRHRVHLEETGWPLFFLLRTLLAIPGMVTLIWVAPNDLRRCQRHASQAGPE